MLSEAKYPRAKRSAPQVPPRLPTHRETRECPAGMRFARGFLDKLGMTVTLWASLQYTARVTGPVRAGRSADTTGALPLGRDSVPMRGWHAAAKRVIDVLVSAILLMVMAVPMLIIAWLVKRDSPGPALYRQTRVGKDGKSFTMLKFRCMVQDADRRRAALLRSTDTSDIRLFKLPDDPRLTGLGRILRRWSLDELPQFLHVLHGDMSLIGPRPPLPEEVVVYDEWHLQRLLVKPGITGLWQVSGRSHLSFDEMVRLDLHYAESWSPRLDTTILLRTIPAVVKGQGAW